MTVETGNEASLITTTAPLVSNSTYGSIITVPGPSISGAAAPVSTPLDIIIT